MRYASLCTGVGGFDIGFDRAGLTCVFQCEKDAAARSVLARHWPDVERTDDVNDAGTADALRRLRPDLLCFGFPCQDLSVAGRRAGLAGERSGLFYRCADLAAESGARWVVIENVPGLLSSNGGRDMGAVLGTLGDLGYWVSYCVLDAQWFGVAQRRRRVFLVGSLGGWGSAEVLFESDGLCGDSPPSREAGARTAGCLSPGAHPGGFNGQDAYTGQLVAGTLGATGNGRGWNDDLERAGAFVPVAFNWQSGGDCRGLNPNEHATNALHVGQTPAVAYQCHGSNVGPMGTLRQGNGSTTGGVPFIVKSDRSHDKQNGAIPAGRARCLDTTGGFAASQGGTVVASPMAVRRLTPRECERLMGWPDDHTRYGHDGKEISDSARYRMCGNGVVGTVSEWIGRRLMEAACA